MIAVMFIIDQNLSQSDGEVHVMATFYFRARHREWAGLGSTL